MNASHDETTNQLLATYQERVSSWARVEMQTRDQDAENYDGFIPKFQTDVELHIYNKVFNQKDRKCSLDVGCGTGRTIETLHGKLNVGIDLSRKSLLVAHAHLGAKVDLIQASATHLPFRQRVFDQLLCAGVVNHIPGEEQRALAVEEASRVSARPARIVFSMHNYSLLARRQFPREAVHHRLFWHRFTPQEVDSMFRRAVGECRIKIWGICTLPRWRIGNRFGPFAKWIDLMLSNSDLVSHSFGALLVTMVDAPKNWKPTI